MTRTPQALLSNTAKEDNLTVLLPIRNPTRASAATPGIYPPPLGGPAYLWSVNTQPTAPRAVAESNACTEKTNFLDNGKLPFGVEKVGTIKLLTVLP